jgi:hypothetical protein
MVLNPVHTDIQTELGLIFEKVAHAGADPEPLLKEAQAKLQTQLDQALASK